MKILSKIQSPGRRKIRNRLTDRQGSDSYPSSRSVYKFPFSTHSLSLTSNMLQREECLFALSLQKKALAFSMTLTPQIQSTTICVFNGRVRAPNSGVLDSGESSRGGVFPLSQGLDGDIQVLRPVRLREEDQSSQVHCQDSATDASPQCSRKVVSTGQFFFFFSVFFVFLEFVSRESSFSIKFGKL